MAPDRYRHIARTPTLDVSPSRCTIGTGRRVATLPPTDGVKRRVRSTTAAAAGAPLPRLLGQATDDAAVTLALPPLLGANWGTWIYRGLALLLIDRPPHPRAPNPGGHRVRASGLAAAARHGP